MQNITHFEKVSFEQFQKDLQKYTKLTKDAKEIYDNIKLPKRATIGSAGYDFFLPFDITLEASQSMIVPTGIRCQMNDDFVLQIFPRSSLGFKYRMQLDNTVGIIDSDYYNAHNEGHIMIKISNSSFEKETIKLSKESAFVQGIFLVYGKTIDDDTKDTRISGIGSTNK